MTYVKCPSCQAKITLNFVTNYALSQSEAILSSSLEGGAGGENQVDTASEAMARCESCQDSYLISLAITLTKMPRPGKIRD